MLAGCGGDSSYGTPAIKVAQKLVLRMHRKEGAIVMPLDRVDEQQALVADDPLAFYITERYAGYPAVLVQRTGGSDRSSSAGKSWRRVAQKHDLAT